MTDTLTKFFSKANDAAARTQAEQQAEIEAAALKQQQTLEAAATVERERAERQQQLEDVYNQSPLSTILNALVKLPWPDKSKQFHASKKYTDNAGFGGTLELKVHYGDKLDDTLKIIIDSNKEITTVRKGRSFSEMLETLSEEVNAAEARYKDVKGEEAKRAMEDTARVANARGAEILNLQRETLLKYERYHLLSRFGTPEVDEVNPSYEYVTTKYTTLKNVVEEQMADWLGSVAPERIDELRQQMTAPAVVTPEPAKPVQELQPQVATAAKKGIMSRIKQHRQ